MCKKIIHSSNLGSDAIKIQSSKCPGKCHVLEMVGKKKTPERGEKTDCPSSLLFVQLRGSCFATRYPRSGAEQAQGTECRTEQQGSQHLWDNQ